MWFLLALSLNSSQAAPWTIPVQGSLTEANGSPVVGSRSVRFSFFDAETGAEVWGLDRVVAFEDGAFSASIEHDGSTIANFGARPAWWLSITPEGGVESGRVRISQVPLATWAADADRLDGHDWSEAFSNDRPPSWANIASIPADIADGDATLSPAQVLAIVQANGLTLPGAVSAAGLTSTGGQPIVTSGAVNGGTGSFTGALSAGSLNAGSGTVATTGAVNGGTGAFTGGVTAASLTTTSGGTTVSDAGITLASPAKITGDGSGLTGVTAAGLSPGTFTTGTYNFNSLQLFVSQVNDYVSPIAYKTGLFTGAPTRVVNVVAGAGKNFGNPSVLLTNDWDWSQDNVWVTPTPPAGNTHAWARVTVSLLSGSNHGPCFWLRREYNSTGNTSTATWTKMAGDPDIQLGCMNTSTLSTPGSFSVWVPWWTTPLTLVSGQGGMHQRLLVAAETNYATEAAGAASYTITGMNVELFASNTSVTPSAGGGVAGAWTAGTSTGAASGTPNPAGSNGGQNWMRVGDVLIQWGNISFNSSGQTNFNVTTVNFPVPFSATPAVTWHVGDTGPWASEPTVTSCGVSTTGTCLQLASHTYGTTTPTAMGNTANPAWWIAIGR